jgi:ABC-type multidrug transport system fused ATPase/permease subunit
MEYQVNKGIGKPPEFNGLQSQYLFIFAGGLLAVFVMFVILFMAGVNEWICILIGGGAATVLVWLTFSLNRKYGAHGLMKLQARMYLPRYLINRLRLSRFFKFKTANANSDVRKSNRENAVNIKLKITNEHEKCNESSHSGE